LQQNNLAILLEKVAWDKLKRYYTVLAAAEAVFVLHIVFAVHCIPTVFAAAEAVFDALLVDVAVLDIVFVLHVVFAVLRIPTVFADIFFVLVVVEEEVVRNEDCYVNYSSFLVIKKVKTKEK
jgi:hypothetical protein